jgi:hypothetical protein
MSAYKSSTTRSSAPSADGANAKFKSEARQLQEFFPSWSNDGMFLQNCMSGMLFSVRFLIYLWLLDLQSLLLETGGDVESAATRITEGQFVPCSIWMFVKELINFFLFPQARQSNGL